MIVYSVDIPQIDQIQQAFAQVPELMAQETIKAGDASLLDFQGGIKSFAPVRTGRYRGSVTIQPMQQRGDVIEGSVGPATHYADNVETGTGIYGPAKRPITPKRATVLAFKVGGKTVFAKSVKGYPGRFPVKKSLEANEEKLEAHFQQAIDNVAQQIAEGLR